MRTYLYIIGGLGAAKPHAVFGELRDHQKALPYIGPRHLNHDARKSTGERAQDCRLLNTLTNCLYVPSGSSGRTLMRLGMASELNYVSTFSEVRDSRSRWFRFSYGKATSSKTVPRASALALGKPAKTLTADSTSYDKAVK